jgi:hypothetical protein
MIERRTLARRSLLSATSILAAFIVIGCVAAPGSSARPASASPGSSESPNASPSDAPSPSMTLSPSMPPSDAPSAGPTGSGTPTAAICGVATWPTGANDLVLRMTVAGGFVAPGVDQTNLPVISVFGDGRVISPGVQMMIYPGPLLSSLQVQRLTPAGMRSLLDAAAAAGLLEPDVTYESNGIADAPTTFFTLVADGCTHHVNAYALSESVSTTGLDQKTIATRAKLLAFSNALGDLTSLVGKDNVADGGLFAATSYRIITRVETPTAGPSPSLASTIAWPLKTPLASFGDPISPGADDTRCGVAAGADAETLAPLFTRAHVETRWTSAGRSYVLRVRPLLPDESGCTTPPA